MNIQPTPVKQIPLLNSLLFVISLILSGCDVSPNPDNPQLSVQEDDPVVADFPIAYIERPLPTDEDGNFIAFDVLEQTAFNPGARLILKDRASASAKETVITAGIFAGLEIDPETGEEISLYDVKDLEVSEDGRKIVFAMRAPEIEDADDDEQPKWNIWEYDMDSGEPQPRRVIPLSLPIKAQQGHDVEPYYLPNGRIIFSSTRQSRTQAVLLDEGKPQYPGLTERDDIEAMVLHTMEDDGSDIEQISFNVSHDMHPTVMQSGEILFLRWDAINNHDQLSLYKANPDGSNVQPYYGFYSQNTGTNGTSGVFLQPRELPDGKIMVALQPRVTPPQNVQTPVIPQLGGDIIAIDASNFIANNQGTQANNGASGPAQQSLIKNAIDSGGVNPSPGGYFSSAYPLDDGSNRLLVSWSQCRLLTEAGSVSRCTPELIEQGAELAPPLFGLWIYDIQEGTQLPIKPPKPNLMYTDAVVLSPKSVFAEDIRNTEVDPSLVNEGVGVLHIRNIYDIGGTDTSPNGVGVLANPTQTPASARPARFMRIVKNVPIPSQDVLDFDNSLFGRNSSQGMRDIVGYIPIEPDGSVKFKVPADIPFMLDILDAQGRRVGQRHENWLYLKAGEERECTGCHAAASTLPHGRLDAEAQSFYFGAVGNTPFPGTQIRDINDTAEADPEAGETMAEYYARLFGARTPSVDLNFEDEWTDTLGNAPAADPFQWRYVNINTAVNANPKDANCAALDNAPTKWESPTQCVDAGSWTNLCRVTINYPKHIQPLWEADRRSCDATQTVIQDFTCTSCHTSKDQDGNEILPLGQLELTGEISQTNNDYITSYFELIIGSNKKIVKTYRDPQGNILYGPVENEFERVFTGAVETDIDGEPILDGNGNTIPLYQYDDTDLNIEINPETGTPFEQYTNGNPILTGRPCDTAGANNSNARFFSLFETGGTHAGYLSQDELKLISEWLDIGGQYYNNPFAAPAN